MSDSGICGNSYPLEIEREDLRVPMWDLDDFCPFFLQFVQIVPDKILNALNLVYIMLLCQFSMSI